MRRYICKRGFAVLVRPFVGWSVTRFLFFTQLKVGEKWSKEDLYNFEAPFLIFGSQFVFNLF